MDKDKIKFKDLSYMVQFGVLGGYIYGLILTMVLILVIMSFFV